MNNGLHLESLGRRWPDGTVGLHPLTLTVAPGEVIAILGRSGAGKSTLLRCASRLIEPTEGRVFIAEKELTGLTGRDLAHARGRVGFVFQQFNLIRSYTALENVLTARVSHAPWLRGLLGLWSQQDREIAQRALTEVGLENKLNALVRDLSGGQQQRVAVARAFAQEPSAVFADEPTASLDPHLASTVLSMLRIYGKNRAVPVLMNVHTVELARCYADRVIGLRDGRLVHDGPAETLTDTDVSQIYGDPT